MKDSATNEHVLDLLLKFLESSDLAERAGALLDFKKMILRRRLPLVDIACKSKLLLEALVKVVQEPHLEVKNGVFRVVCAL